MGGDEIDLARGTFVEKWPSWVRWLLFLPSSLIAPMLWVLIQTITATWFLDVGNDAFWFNLMRGMAYGGGIVFVGAMVAPKKQKIIALILLVIISMGSGLALLQQTRHFVLNGFLEDIVTLGAAIYATYYIFQESNKQDNSNL